MDLQALTNGDVTTTDEWAARVARLWREQGEDFLDAHHDAIVDDVERLRDSSVEGDNRWQQRVTEARTGLGRVVHSAADTATGAVGRLRDGESVLRARLRELDDVGPGGDVDTLDALQNDDVIVDLTGDEPIVVIRTPATLRCQRHGLVESQGPCRECRGPLCPHCAVHPFGDDRPGLCVDCALVLGGIRRPR